MLGHVPLAWDFSLQKTFLLLFHKWSNKDCQMYCMLKHFYNFLQAKHKGITLILFTVILAMLRHY